MTDVLTIIIIFSDWDYINIHIIHSGILWTLKVLKKLRCHFLGSEVLKAFRLHEGFKIQYYCYKALLLYGLDTFQTEPPTEQMSLSLAQPIDWPVNHHSDKHLPVLSHLSSFVKVCWTVKSFKRFEFCQGFYFINYSILPVTEEGREISKAKWRKRQHLSSPTGNNCFLKITAILKKRKHRSIKKPELLTSANYPNSIPVIYSTGLYTYP